MGHVYPRDSRIGCGTRRIGLRLVRWSHLALDSLRISPVGQRARTCNQTVVSGKVQSASLIFTAVSSAFDCVRCVLMRSSPQLAASFISGKACNVACWPDAADRFGRTKRQLPDDDRTTVRTALHDRV
jgi:hypothetical protein